ncbi:hypothetical protein [Nocardia farcinica]|uniref:hypothetical protein n=1 Tax=Nocardia farcinica TaxID=37329 RepID=UPI0018940C9C|nr:hypothetical protein [Nocardia farcinica]MBF6576364.1 hypothetical protein [Nocardia farcinica]
MPKDRAAARVTATCADPARSVLDRAGAAYLGHPAVDPAPRNQVHRVIDRLAARVYAPS